MDALGGRQDVTAVQIGSHDGQLNDPLRPLLLRNPTWRGLFVEPVPYLFERLCENYGPAPRFQFANVAVGETEGTFPFHYLDPAARRTIPDIPVWYEQIGSFDRQHITKHFGNTYDAFLVTTQVSTLPLERLLARHGIGKMDILHVDAEGHDWIILGQLDLTRHHPEIILFEHRHLSQEEHAAARAFLADYYRMTDLGSDYLCVAVRSAA